MQAHGSSLSAQRRLPLTPPPRLARAAVRRRVLRSARSTRRLVTSPNVPARILPLHFPHPILPLCSFHLFLNDSRKGTGQLLM